MTDPTYYVSPPPNFIPYCLDLMMRLLHLMKPFGPSNSVVCFYSAKCLKIWITILTKVPTKILGPR